MRPGLRTAVVLGVFAALTALLAFPLSTDPGTRALPLSADTRLFLWTISWDVHALAHRPLRVFDANIFFPERRTLAYSEHLLGSAVLGAPFLAASGNPLLALNAIVLLSCVLSGAGAYLLARRLGIGVSGALAAGLVFAFAPPRFTRLAQVHVASVQWIPFCLAFLHAYASTRRRRDLLAAAAFFTLQALTSGHGGLFLLLAVAALLPFLGLFGRLPSLGPMLRDLGFAGAAILAANALFLVPYAIVQREVGLHRTLGAVYDWAPNAVSFLAAPTHAQETLLSLVPGLRQRVMEGARAYLFPGWLTLALAALALARRRQAEARMGLDLGFYAVLALVSLWASLGPGFGLYSVLYRLVPGFDLIRVPSRLTVLTLLALAVLAGAGLERLLSRLAPGRRNAAAGAVLLLLTAEFASFPLRSPPYTIDIPAVDRWLASRPRPFTLAELPVADPGDATRSARFHSHYMLHSMAHWQPMVNGYSGIVPPRHEALFRTLVRFPDAASLAALEALGVQYVVLHKEFYAAPDWDRVQRELTSFADRLRLEHTEPDGSVYTLTAARSRP